MRPTFDERDAAILAQRESERNTRPGPRVGDFVKMKDGTLRRFSHDYGEDIQTTYRWQEPKNAAAFNRNSDPMICCGGDFYLAEGGGVSFSGSLDSALLKSTLKDTGEQRDGRFWFFHHNYWQASNGVDVTIKCRVFEQV
jgi:hypothetical protein